ncbi:MAG: cupin [Bacteroidetes bacterium]|nr:MAG: cupin [Bacteroidota bacterium]
MLTVSLLSIAVLAQESSITGEELSVLKTIDDTGLEWGPCPPFMPEGCAIAVLHGDPSKVNVDVLFKVEANSDIPNHWHNSPERMILLSGELKVKYEGEKTQTMKIGSYAYGPSKKPHTAKCGDDGPCIIFIAFENPLDAFEIVEGQ